jgi:hypothetical protein
MNARWMSGGLVDRIGAVQGWLAPAPPSRVSARVAHGRREAPVDRGGRAGLGVGVGLG